MIRVWRIFQIIFICFLMFSWGCGSRGTSALTVGVNPSQPLLIPTSSAVNGSTTGPVAPYFSMNSLKIIWSGTTSFQLLALTFYAGSVTGGSSSSSSTAQSFNCGGSGTAITGIFGSANITDCHSAVVQPALDVNQNLTIPAPTPGCPYSVQSSGFYCDSLPVTVNPNPLATYNIPVEVIVFGESLDTSGDATGRVTGIANITIQ
jgi:hypothetical protein